MMNEAAQQTEDLKKLRSRINWFCDNKVNAFSPTISPAPKSVARGEIESIYEGIRFFAERGVQEIVVQKKYMGSYCDIYLHKNREETYFVSRNGHRIRHIDIQAAQQACDGLHSRFDWDKLQLVIIQAELMPWGILGKGLIENEFEGYLNAHQNHAHVLQAGNLYDKIQQVKDGDAYKNFIRDRDSMTAKQWKQKYPTHIIRQYSALEQFKILDMEQYRQGIQIYEEQIGHFGKEAALHFKPFNILKKVFNDGTEVLVNDNASYTQVNEDEMLQLVITDPGDIEAQAEIVYEWFDTLMEGKEEGIVIKPRQAFIPGLPPAFKVRNNHYLTMIYGVHFQQDLAYNIQKRSIGRKLACSVNDWAINHRMLSVPYAEVHKENYYFKNLVYDRIIGERAEAMLDTRL